MGDYPLFFEGDLGIICGGVRNGKTLLLMSYVQYALQHGYSVYYNMKSLSFPDLDPNNYISDLESFKEMYHEIMNDTDLIHQKKFLALDELGTFIPTLDYSKLKWSGPYWTQLNKIGFTTYGTSQAFDMVYNRYRNNANKRVLVERMQGTDYFKVTVQVQSMKYMEKYKTLFSYFFIGSDYYNFYDTCEVLYI